MRAPAATPRFRILGPIELSNTSIGGPRQVALLAFLLVHANRAVSLDQLIDALWPDQPATGAVKRAHVAIVRLRKTLDAAAGPNGGALRTHGSGYLLAVEDGQLDADVFAAHVREARDLLGAARPNEAATVLREGLAMWRGPPLADVASESFAQAEIRRLDELRLAAVELTLDSKLAAGLHREVLSDLEALVAEHPLREHLHGQLMLALYRSGRQADALQAYRHVRVRLADELGLEPGPDLRELERAILNHDPALTASPARPERHGAALPVALRRTAPFVGRQTELARLRQGLLAAADRPSTLVLIGEAGVGKTSLAAGLAREAHAAGSAVLFGRCDDESLFPYQPFAEALQTRFAADPELLEGERLAGERAELGRLLPRLAVAADPPPSDPELARFRLFDAVVAVTEAIVPALLVLDDLHWADAPTLLMLRYVARHGPPGLTLLGTARPVGSGTALAQWLLDQQRAGADGRIELAGLPLDATSELIAARAGQPAHGELAAWVHRRTAGNPFFVEQLVEEIAGRVELDQAPETGTLERIAAPAGVKELVGQRVSSLPPGSAEVMAIAAVIGPVVDLWLLERLVEPPADALKALDDGVAAQLLTELPGPGGRFRFAHALVREAIAGSMTAARRASLHLRIGEAIEGAGDAQPATVAHHFHEARLLGAARKATDYSRQAAAQATRALAYEEAVAHYRRAVETIDDDSADRCELLLALGDAEQRAGDAAARETFALAADIARAASRPLELGRAALGFAGRYAETRLDDPAANTLLEEAIGELGEDEGPVLVRLLARLADGLHLTGAPERTEALSRRALALARRLRDPSALVVALDCRHTALLHIEHLDERLRLNDELLALATGKGDREVEALARHWRICDLLEAGDVIGAQAQHRALAQLAAHLRQPMYEYFVLCWQSTWEQTADRLDAAASLATEAYQLARRGQREAADSRYSAQLLALAYWRDELPASLPAFEAFSIANPVVVGQRATLALSYLEAGERAKGVAEFEQLTRGELAVVPRDMLWLATLCMLSEVCARIGDVTRASTLYALLEPYRARSALAGLVGYWGSAERYLGLLAATLGRWDDAAAHFEVALATNATGGVHHANRKIRLEYADMLRARSAARV